MKIQSIVQLLIFPLMLFSCKKVQQTAEEHKPAVQSAYVNKVYEFKPAPGQFTNDGSSTDAAKTSLLIGNVGEALVSLGGYGGYIIVGFDHSVTNATGADLGIYGNPLVVAGMEFSEPGIVSVMQDQNKNGLPDDTWYELAGAAYTAASTIKNYTITYYRPSAVTDDIRWTDNQGKEGLILRNAFHTQNYFPAWATGNEISYTGTLLSNTLAGGDIITNKPLGIGYADNGSSEFLALQQQLGRGYNTFDIDWAVDARGAKVALTSIDFLKIYTGQNSNGNPFHPDNNNERARFVGEISTEFAGAADLKLLIK